MSDSDNSDDENEKKINTRQHYSLELHDRSEQDKYFKQVLQNDDLPIEEVPVQDVYFQPITEKLYTRGKYDTMIETGLIPYLRKCEDLHIVPSSRICQCLETESMNLAHYGVNEEGTSALAAALLVNSKVTALDLQDNWIGDRGAAALAFAFTAPESKQEIKFLNLKQNSLGSAGGHSITRIFSINTTLTEVRLGGTNLNNNHAESLANALRENKTLIKLDLSANNIGARGGAALAMMLESNVYLQSLWLAWNSLGDEGATKLASVFEDKDNEVLSELDLSWNGIGAVGAMKWADAIKENTSLKILDLSNNRIQGGKAWDALNDQLKANHNNKGLKQIKLTGNNLLPQEAFKMDAISLPSQDQKDDEKKGLAFVVFEGMERLLLLAKAADKEKKAEEEHRENRERLKKERVKREAEEAERIAREKEEKAAAKGDKKGKGSEKEKKSKGKRKKKNG